jgi:hypothetical protein
MINQKENKSQWRPSVIRNNQNSSEIPCTGPYPVTNVYKNGTIRIQKGQNRLLSKRLNTFRITRFNKDSIKYDRESK